MKFPWGTHERMNRLMVVTGKKDERVKGLTCVLQSKKFVLDMVLAARDYHHLPHAGAAVAGMPKRFAFRVRFYDRSCEKLHTRIGSLSNSSSVWLFCVG